MNLMMFPMGVADKLLPQNPTDAIFQCHVPCHVLIAQPLQTKFKQ
jgi:hypothetical protein